MFKKQKKITVLDKDRIKAQNFKNEFFWTIFKVLDFNEVKGDYLEFGCHSGKTFLMAYNEIQDRKINRHLWAYDSFLGLPKTESDGNRHPKWIEGTMRTEKESFIDILSRNNVSPSDYSIVEGYYHLSLVDENTDKPEDVAFVYVDCDMYESTCDVLKFIEKYLKHGMIIGFDDYHCYTSEGISGERKAFEEWSGKQDKWIFTKYRHHGWAGESFIVERADLCT